MGFSGASEDRDCGDAVMLCEGFVGDDVVGGVGDLNPGKLRMFGTGEVVNAACDGASEILVRFDDLHAHDGHRCCRCADLRDVTDPVDVLFACLCRGVESRLAKDGSFDTVRVCLEVYDRGGVNRGIGGGVGTG